MGILTDYTGSYNALPKHRRKLLRQQAIRWGSWTSTTFYRKLSGDSLTAIERVMLDGLFYVYSNRDDAEQLLIKFVWDTAENCPKLEFENLA